MSTENNIGVQTRAMAQWVDNEANPEQVQKATNQATTPTVELHRTKEDTIKEFVRQHGTISLDWYVPDLCNTRVGDLIEKRLQLGTMEGRILFSSPALNEFFKTSNFELNLQTGEELTYLDPPENIGITCQKEPFDIESLRDTLQGEYNTGPIQEERLERIPIIRMALILSECTHHANQLNHEDSRFDMVLSSLLNIMETAGIHFEITMKRGHTHAMWLVTAEKSFTLVETHV